MISPLRVFISAPLDVKEEEEVARKAIQELNASNATASTGYRFETAASQSGKSTARTKSDSTFSIRECDIFLGIVWLEFNPPLNTGDSSEAQDGTLAQFELTRGLNRQTGSPKLLLLRNMRSPEALTEFDIEKFLEIKNHFKGIENEPEKISNIYINNFKTKEEMERQVIEGLLDLAQKFPLPQSIFKTGEDPGERESTVDFRRELKDGEAYPVAFVSVDMAKHSELIRTSGATEEQAQLLLDEFKFYSTRIAHQYGGDVFSWAGDGGLLIFWKEEHYRAGALSAGLRLLHELPLFNMEKNPVNGQVSIRVAGKSGTLLYRAPPREISSQDINFVEHLQKQKTRAGEFCIAETLLDNMNVKFCQKFSSAGRFEGEPIHSFAPPLAGRLPPAESLEGILEDVALQSSRIGEFLESPEHDTMPKAVSSAIDSAYSSLDRFVKHFSKIDDRWSPEYLAKVEKQVSDLLSEERGIWRSLRRYHFHEKDSAVESEIAALIAFASSRRGQPVVSLEKLRGNIHELRGKIQRKVNERQEKPGHTKDQKIVLQKKIRSFVEADDLERETMLIDLIMNYRNDLAKFILDDNSALGNKKLVEVLWSVAELPLLDNLHPLYGHRRQGDAGIFQTLAELPELGKRFRIVNDLLLIRTFSEPSTVFQKFREAGISPDIHDLETAWRCLLIGHEDQGVRESAAGQLGSQDMWKVVAHSTLPTSALYAVGLRIADGTEDFKRIFFDCTRRKIEVDISTAVDHESFLEIKKVLSLFLEFDFMVETVYFERIDALLNLYTNRAEDFHYKVDFFGDGRRQIENERKRRKKPRGDLPKGIAKLPLTLQRQLAGELVYLFWFISHPDDRIAEETFRHIGLHNVERVLRSRELNGYLLRKILERNEFFTRLSPVAAALNHPKCSVRFARIHIPVLCRTKPGRKVLQRLSSGASAQSDIRALARAALERR